MDKEIQSQLYDPGWNAGRKNRLWARIEKYKRNKDSVRSHHRRVFDPKKHSKKKNPMTWKGYLKAKMSIYMKRYGSHKAAIRKIAKEWKTAKVRVLDPKKKPFRIQSTTLIGSEQEKRRLEKAGFKVSKVYEPTKANPYYRIFILQNPSHEKAYDPAPKKHGINRPPKRWFAAMLKGIEKRSDVRNPAAIVASIWKRLSPTKRSEIKRRELAGKPFKYDLPLPDDKTTRGPGTLRMVKPFKLAEVQVNVSLKDYIAALKSGLFQKMKRGDGSTALVARCKSTNKNCNIFVDKDVK